MSNKNIKDSIKYSDNDKKYEAKNSSWSIDITQKYVKHYHPEIGIFKLASLNDKDIWYCPECKEEAPEHIQILASIMGITESVKNWNIRIKRARELFNVNSW